MFDEFSVKFIGIATVGSSTNEDRFKDYGGRENPNIRQWYIDQLDALPYLKRLDIGTEELVVYENEGYLPYIRTTTDLLRYDSFTNLEEKYDLSSGTLGRPFDFVVPQEGVLPTYPSTHVTHLFEDMRPSDVSGGAIHSTYDNERGISAVYVNTNQRELRYTRSTDRLTFYETYTPGLNLDGAVVDTHLASSTVIADIPLKTGEYVGVQGDALVSLPETETSKHITLSQGAAIYHIDDANSIENGDFEYGQWQEMVGDCNNFDNDPLLGMSLSRSAHHGSSSLELMATRHIACTTTFTRHLEAGSTYVLAFSYQGDPAQQAGYYLSFGLGTSTVISEHIPLSGNEWHEYSRMVKVPDGAERAQLYLYAYTTDNKTANIVRYDNVRFARMEKVAEVSIGDQTPRFEANALPTNESYDFTFSDPTYDLVNRIPNDSLENGLWSDTIGDCNNHDDDPILGMRSADVASDGTHSLELSATRHIACTGPGPLAVTGGSRYMFSFDYQSENAKEAGYYIGFSGSTTTPPMSERITIPKDAHGTWQTYTKIFKVPDGVNSASLVVYAYATDEESANIVRYDNFHLFELPPLHNRYYLVSDPQTDFTEPRSVTFDLVNPTKKLVHIKGATTPFYLAMSESYHQQWQAQLTNDKNNGFFDSWVPWARPDTIPDDHHFELNGFLNGWYVDTATLCTGTSTIDVDPANPGTVNSELGTRNSELGTNNSSLRPGCTRNPDGSYDIELTLEFTPQRWFYLGLLISGTTLVGCVGYLVYDLVRRRQTRNWVLGTRSTRYSELGTRN